MGIEGQWQIPRGNIIQVLAVLLAPTVIGISLRKLNANVGTVVELVGAVLGVFVILFLLGSWVPRNWQLLLATGPAVYFGSIGLGVIGFALGYALSRLLRQQARSARTIALETGIQNGPLAALIVLLSFPGPEQQQVLLIPVVHSLFIVLTSCAVTVWFGRLTTREELARDQAKLGAVLVAR